MVYHVYAFCAFASIVHSDLSDDLTVCFEVNCNANSKTYSDKDIIMHILRGDLLSFNKNVMFWRFFIIFNILNISV